jgi:hypothetical protein
MKKTFISTLIFSCLHFVNLQAQDLEVTGKLTIKGGAPASGKVLTSNSIGLATWETPSGPQGPQGPPGPQGPQGPQGPAGTYTAGTGLVISTGTISAQNTTALWNANLLQGLSILNQTPTAGQVLTWSPAGSSNPNTWQAATLPNDE